MSFEHAPVSKGLIMAFASTSIVAGIFDVKHYLHLQLVPHISVHHQYWRLLVHHLAFSNSTDLFLASLLFFHVGVQVERQFGSHKFASFVAVSVFVSTIFEFLFLLLFHRVGLNQIPSGPLSLLFAILYQHSRIVPSAYQFRIFGIPLNNKSFNDLMALQISLSRLPSSLIPCITGMLTGQLYRSEMSPTPLKTYRLPPPLVSLSRSFLLPVIGAVRPPRRSNRALPDEPTDNMPSASSRQNDSNENEEVITTARPSPDSLRTRGRQNQEAPSAMREWVNELTGRRAGSTRNAVGLRNPPESEVGHITTMFPDMEREVVIAALQRSSNVEEAVETLLNSTRT